MNHDRGVVAARRRQLPEGHPDILTADSNLARHLHALTEQRATEGADEAVVRGLHDEAFGIDLRTQAARQKLLGERHPDTMQSTHNIARYLAVIGKHSEALELNEANLERRREVYGEQHWATKASRAAAIENAQALAELDRVEGPEGAETPT